MRSELLPVTQFCDKIIVKRDVMKKIIILCLLIIGLYLPCAAELNQNMELSSETGIVEAISYEEVPGLQQGSSSLKQIADVKVISGKYKGTERSVDNMLTGNPAYDIPLKPGDKVILHVESRAGEVLSADDVDFFIADIKRDNTLLFVSGLFFLCLVLIGRKKGLYSLISIFATAALIFWILVPFILHGFSPVAASVFVCVISSIITIYLVGGFNAKSTSAIIGTVLSLIMAGILSMLVILFARLTGFAGEENMFLYSAHSNLNFKGILASSMMIAALGALMDTAVSIASTINEIYETDKGLSIRQLFNSGMNVGRDIIGTMSNTLILVYLGSSLPLVLLSSNIDLQKFFNLNQVATEISSALVGSIAILACVPLTAITASCMIKKRRSRADFNFERKG